MEHVKLNLHDIRSCTCFEPIQLDNECQCLCLNESAAYVFALVKPRVLFMYRRTDARQLAKLFVYDFVLSMVADNDFLVLALNDHRLLTLMIADPDDPTLQSRIKALPSRNPQHLRKSATQKLLTHMEKCGSFSSSEEDESDIEESDKKVDENLAYNELAEITRPKFTITTSLFRFVTQLNGQHALSKMRKDEEIRSQVMTFLSLDDWKNLDITKMADDSTDENHDDDNDVEVPGVVKKTEEQQNIDVDLNDIRQKTLEYDEKQIKGVQFANAGDGNVKIVNSHTINSSTCTVS